MLHHGFVHVERLVLVLELLALLEIHVEHHHVGIQTTTLCFFHDEGGQLDGVARLQHLGVVANVQLVGEGKKLHHFGLNVSGALTRRNAADEVLLLAAQRVGVETRSALRFLVRVFLLLILRSVFRDVVYSPTTHDSLHLLPNRRKRRERGRTILLHLSRHPFSCHRSIAFDSVNRGLNPLTQRGGDDLRTDQLLWETGDFQTNRFHSVNKY